MAHVISDECVSCGSCEAECPVGAISEGDGKYEIDAECLCRTAELVKLRVRQALSQLSNINRKVITKEKHRSYVERCFFVGT